MTDALLTGARTAALIPRNIVIVLLRIYRAVISPLYGQVCRYYPSCSAYGLGCVQEHGVVRGGWLTVRRLARCHPWADGGIDDIPLKENSPYRRTRWGLIVLDRKA
jgi:putative membrane protein insertion efficiency factor